MLTLALYGLLAIGLMGALFLVAVRFLPAGEQIAAPVRDEPVWALPPDRTLTAPDIAELRLPVSLRGYRFAETDELLDRLVDELQARDTELDRVYGLLSAAGIPREPAAQAEATDPDTAAPVEHAADEQPGPAAGTQPGPAAGTQPGTEPDEHGG